MKKKLENYWYHYKWHTIVGAFFASMIIMFISEMLGIVHPDYIVGFVSTKTLTSEAQEEMEAVMASYVDDINGDGQVYVAINYYQLDFDDSSDAETLMANMTRIFANVSSKEVFLFIMDDLNSYRDLFAEMFVDVNGEVLQTVENSPEDVDNTLYGFAFEDIEMFSDIKYYDYSLFDVYEGSRVIMMDYNFHENYDEEEQAVYDQSMELYEILKNN